jgi:SAM-dependent methyltransferase
MGPDGWWRGFFQGLAVETWMRATTERATRSEVEFLLRVAGGGGAPPRVLDVPCGHGRHAVGLAERGCDVTGVDLSPEFLEEARGLAARRGVTVRWEERDMRDLPRTGEFDAACCFGNSFGYMDDAANAEFLGAVARALRPGGKFLMEAGAATAEVALAQFQERRWFEYGDLLFLLHNRFDHEASRIETEFTFVLGDVIERRGGSQRVYTYRELTSYCRTAGFEDIQGFSGVTGEPFRLGATRLLLVATTRA